MRIPRAAPPDTRANAAKESRACDQGHQSQPGARVVAGVPVQGPGFSFPGIGFHVHGPISTKGSTRSFPHRRTGEIVTVADARSLPAWTQAIAWSARQAGLRPLPRPRGVALEVMFLLQRPASVSYAARPLPIVKPDLDKCLRALLDALTGIAYEDDAQVVWLHAEKCYVVDRTETVVHVWEKQL